MTKIIRIEEGIVKKLMDIPGIEVNTEQVVHVNFNNSRVVSIHPLEKYAEFDEDFRDPTSHGHSLKPLIDYLYRENYETNLK